MFPPLSFIEVKPIVIDKRYDRDGDANGVFYINNELAKTGGIFAVTVDWCHFCKELKNNVLAAQNASPFPFFFMSATDSQHDRALSAKLKEMGIEYFPNVYKIEFGGKLNEYNGGRSPSALAALAKPSSSIVGKTGGRAWR